MIKKVLAMAILSLLIHTAASVRPALATSKPDKQSRLTQKVRLAVAKLGVGKDAVIEVRLHDKSKLTGFVSEAGDNHFIVTDEKTGSSNTVAYADVTKVRGHNLSTGAKIGIGIAIGFALTAAIVFLTR
jgi:hypothetical protein